MILFNLKIAWRNIRKNKVFSSINILGLALSMLCCMVISLYIWNELRHDSFHTHLKHIYRVTEKQNQAGTLYDVAVTPGPLAPALKTDFSELVNTVRFGSWSGVLKTGSSAFEENGILLTENSVFNIFSFPLIKGNKATALGSPDQMIITERTAEKYFGKDWANNPTLLGQLFTLNNTDNFKLAGVVKNPPANSSIQFDVLLPLSYLFATDKWSNQWNSNNYHTYLQVKPETDIASLENKLSKQLSVYNKETEDLLLLQPLAKQYLYSKFDFNTDWGKRSDIKYVKIFAAVGLLLLIIACVNFINLSTARSLKRSLEVGVRKVNGASRRQLILQFLSESFLVTLLAGLFSIVLLKLSQPYIQLLTGRIISINYTGTLFLTLFFGFVLVIGLLAGLYPAFVLSSFKAVKVLKGKGAVRSGKPFWKALVVFQFAISITLMVCTVFMYRQLRYVQNKDLGFNKEQLLSLRLKGGLSEKALLIKNDLDKESSILASAPATMSLVNVDNSSYVEWEGMQPDDKFLISQANISPEFIPALGMQLLVGSNFTEQKTNDTANYIVNETAVKRMGYNLGNVIGRQIDFWGNKGRIIGVVKDFHFKPLNTGINPFIFRYQPKERYFNLLVKTAPGKTPEAIAKLQAIYRKYDSDFPADFNFVNESINRLYQDDQRTANFILLFACLSIFIGCLGLFGLTVFAAEQRVKEIGIRKVLGAGISSLAKLLSKDFLKLVALATVIAIPIAWWITSQWLQNFAYRIHIDAWVFAVAGLAVIAAAMLTISIQTIKAAIANPVKSLRAD